MLRTKSLAEPDSADGAVLGASYRVTGDKHFGSGSGVTSFMVTTAVPAGEEAPTIFVLDVRDRPWDGSAGMRLTAEWDGAGMAATQSHAMRLESCPATRIAWDGPVQDLAAAAGPMIASVFTAVVLGVLDEAIATARQQLQPKVDTLRAVRAGGVGACGDGALVGGAGVRGRLAVRRGRRPRVAVGAASEGSGGRAGRVVAAADDPRHRRRHVLPALSVRLMVRGRPRPRLPARPPWGLAYDVLLATSFDS